MTMRLPRRWCVSALAAAVISLTIGVVFASTTPDSEPKASTVLDSEPKASTAPDSEPKASTAPDSEPRTWLAQSSAPQKAAPPPEVPRSRWRGVAVAIGALGIAALAIYLRKSGRFASRLPETTRLRVLSSVRVSPKGYVVLIGVGDRAMLVGATDGSIRRLAWLKAERIGLEASTGQDETGSENRSAPTDTPGSPSTAADDSESGSSSALSMLNSSALDPAKGARAASPTPSFANILRGLLGTGRPRGASPATPVGPARGQADLSPAGTTPKRVAEVPGVQGGAAETVANAQKDMLEWSPRLKTAQMGAASQTATRRAGQVGSPAPAPAGSTTTGASGAGSAAGAAESPNDLPIEEQASGLVGRAKRRRK